MHPFDIPSRASDSGPLSQPEPPEAWDDLAIVAEEELRDARRLYRDSLALQRKLRLECLDRAEVAIMQARAALETSGCVITSPEQAELVRAYAATQVLG